jgi:hypothetical protein
MARIPTDRKKNGRIDSIKISPAVAEYSGRQIAAMIKKSEAQWMPAFSGGRNVNSYFEMPLVICFSTQ